MATLYEILEEVAIHVQCAKDEASSQGRDADILGIEADMENAQEALERAFALVHADKTEE
jgi:hypothetical protein